MSNTNRQAMKCHTRLDTIVSLKISSSAEMVSWAKVHLVNLQQYQYPAMLLGNGLPVAYTVVVQRCLSVVPMTSTHS